MHQRAHLLVGFVSLPHLSCTEQVRFARMSRRGPDHAVTVSHSQPGALLDIRYRVLDFRPAVVSGIFLAVDRCQMRRISIEIRSPDSKLLPVCIDPLPEAFSGNTSLRLCRAFDAHGIGRKPVAIAAAETAAMV